MDHNLENNDWKKEAPALAALPVHHPFSVPEGYFQEMTSALSNRIYLEKMKIRVESSGFNTPEGYFEELNQDIHAAIITERLKAAVPAGEFATVPVNYFEKLHSNIISRASAGQKTETPSKVVRLWHSAMLKYASAACFVIMSATALYFYNQHERHTKLAYNDVATEQMLYDIDEQVIIDHIEANDLQQVKPAATDVALENYILNNYTQSDIALDL